MGIFDLIKKLIRENKAEEIAIEKLTFSDIGNWIENKIKEKELKQNEIILIINDKIDKHNNELNKKIKILKGFDVEAKKEKDKIKEIVNHSRKDYIESFENFLEKLNNLEINGLEDSMKKINKIFFDFSKSSYKNYERATILIGKEMASIKDGVRVFSKDLLKTYEENKDVTDYFKTILQIKSKYQNINTVDNILDKIIETKSDLDKKISEKEKENRILKENVEEIKKSQNYLDHLATQKKIEYLKEESKNDVLALKQLLDFKALANFFHINQEQIKIVKEHRENFYTHFIEDDGKSIIGLLDESKLNNDKIVEKIKEIYSKLDETKNHEQEIKKDKTQEIYPKIKEVVLEIDYLKIEKVKEEKRDGKLRTNKEELINSLKQDLDKMNVEFILQP